MEELLLWYLHTLLTVQIITCISTEPGQNTTAPSPLNYNTGLGGETLAKFTTTPHSTTVPLGHLVGQPRPVWPAAKTASSPPRRETPLWPKCVKHKHTWHATQECGWWPRDSANQQNIFDNWSRSASVKIGSGWGVDYSLWVLLIFVPNCLVSLEHG